jgi:hypothetical protein
MNAADAMRTSQLLSNSDMQSHPRVFVTGWAVGCNLIVRSLPFKNGNLRPVEVIMSHVMERAVLIVLVFSASLGYSSRAGTPSTAPSGASPAPPDLSTPELATRAYWAAIWTEDPQAIRNATTGGTAVQYHVFAAFHLYAQSAQVLYHAAIAKFGDSAKATALCNSSVMDPERKSVRLETKIDGDTATVTAPDHAKQPAIVLLRKNGAWRVDLALMPPFNVLQSAQFRTRSRILSRTADDIADGQYGSAQEALQAFLSALQVAYKPTPRGQALAQGPAFAGLAVDAPPAKPLAGYNPGIVDAHRQKYDMSCIPMSIELVLKLLGREPAGYFELQEAWKNKTDGNFIDFDGRTIAGLTFHQQFDELRTNDFPTEDLFKTIDSELDHNRYVIVSLDVTAGYHMYVIVGRAATGEYHAVSENKDTALTITNVKARIREMKGTDILTYTMDGANHSAISKASGPAADHK